MLAELAYWKDTDTDPNQVIRADDGGTVNIHDKVFGCGAGSTVDSYNANAINNNPYKTFSVPIMAGFLGEIIII